MIDPSVDSSAPTILSRVAAVPAGTGVDAAPTAFSRVDGFVGTGGVLGHRMPKVSPSWLALREPADAVARSGELAALAGAGLPVGSRVVIHDLGCGTGSMGRWLAPRLPVPQHWVLHDRDPDLLARAATTTADGTWITAEVRPGDLADLTADDLAGADLVTASALLDLLTLDEVDRLAGACAGRPTLWTLSVAGRVELTPADPLDGDLGAAFNEHQRRTVGDRRLLGPEAIDAAVRALRRHGSVTTVRPSSWQLGPGDGALVTEWLAGWVGAACEQRPELTGAAEAYTGRRLVELAEGHLRVVVHHDDILARHV